MYQNEIIARITFVDVKTNFPILNTTDIEVFKKYFPTNENLKITTNEINTYPPSSLNSDVIFKLSSGG